MIQSTGSHSHRGILCCTDVKYNSSIIDPAICAYFEAEAHNNFQDPSTLTAGNANALAASAAHVIDCQVLGGLPARHFYLPVSGSGTYVQVNFANDPGERGNMFHAWDVRVLFECQTHAETAYEIRASRRNGVMSARASSGDWPNDGSSPQALTRPLPVLPISETRRSFEVEVPVVPRPELRPESPRSDFGAWARRNPNLETRRGVGVDQEVEDTPGGSSGGDYTGSEWPVQPESTPSVHFKDWE